MTTGGRGISQQGTVLQSGTGAVLETIEAKERQIVSVKDFGAVGDGTTDDTAAIQAALNLAAPVVYFPAGTYKVTGLTLTALANAHLMGAGAKRSVISVSSGTAISLAGSANSDTVFGEIVTIEKLGFSLSGTSKAFAVFRPSSGVLQGLPHVNVHDCIFYSADGGTGIDLVGVVSGTITRNIFYGVPNYASTFRAISLATDGNSFVTNVNITGNTFSSIQDGVYATSTAAAYTHNAGHRIVNNLFIGLAGYGFYGQYLDTATISDNMMDFVTNPIYADSIGGLVIQNNPYIESRTTNPAIDIEASSGTLSALQDLKITGNQIHGNTVDGIVVNAGSSIAINFLAISENNINVAQTAIKLNAAGTPVFSSALIARNIIHGASTGISFGAQSTACRVDGNVFDNISTFIGGSGLANQSYGVNLFNGSPSNKPHTLTYSSSMTPDGLTSDKEVITATNGTAFAINAPTNTPGGNTLTFYLKNTSGGALGTATWNAVYKLAGSWTNPATGNGRTITFLCSGGLWQELSRSAADVPN